MNIVCNAEIDLYNAADRNLLPKTNIKDSNGRSAYASFDHANYTCFTFDSASPTGEFPSIVMNFTQPVVITRAITLFPIALRGGSGIEEVTFVNRYTIETSHDGVNYTFYRDAAGYGAIYTDAVNTFWRPLEVRQFLRLTIVDAITAHNQVCWHLELFGCMASEGL